MEFLDEKLQIFLPHLVDAHCHPNDAFEGEDVQRMKSETQGLKVGKICVMSSSLKSLNITQELSKIEKVIPAYGVHPWFSHSISINSTVDQLKHYKELFREMTEIDEDWIQNHLSDLPSPMDLNEFLEDLRSRLESEPNSILGEVGLDRAFVLQVKSQDGTIEKSNLKVPIEHQLRVLESQIEIAIQLSRNISLHGVQCQEEVLKLFKRLKQRYKTKLTGTKNAKVARSKNRSDSELGIEEKEETVCEGINICWHSAFISVETLTQVLKILPDTAYFSFAIVLFEGRSLNRLDSLIKNTPDDKLLVESDWGSDPQMIDRKILEILNQISVSKSWTLEICVEQVQKNWKQFSRN